MKQNNVVLQTLSKNGGCGNWNGVSDNSNGVSDNSNVDSDNRSNMAGNTRFRSRSEKANADATELKSIPLKIVKKILNVQESTMKSCFSAYMDYQWV